MKRVMLSLGVSIELADGRFDITDTLEADSPFTLAREDGIGAFQLSLARFSSGAVPNATAEDLRGMLESFGSKRNLGSPIDVRIHDQKVRCIGGSFSSEDFIRVWYATNGRSFIFASHVAAHTAPEEVAVCEQMIRSVEFSKPEPNQPSEPTPAAWLT